MAAVRQRAAQLQVGVAAVRCRRVHSQQQRAGVVVVLYGCRA